MAVAPFTMNVPPRPTTTPALIATTTPTATQSPIVVAISSFSSVYYPGDSGTMEVTTDAQASVAAWLTTQADAPATLADVTVQHVGKSLWRIRFSFGDTMSPGALILTVEATRGATETRTTRILVLQPLTGQAIRGRSALQLAYQVANTMMSCNKNFFEVVTTMQSMILSFA